MPNRVVNRNATVEWSEIWASFAGSYVDLRGLEPRPDPAVPFLIRYDNSNTAHLPLLLIGMITQSHAGDYADEFASTDDQRRTADSQFNVGISAVMSIDIIMDFVMSDRLKQIRANSIAADRFFYFLCADDVPQVEKDARIILLNLHA